MTNFENLETILVTVTDFTAYVILNRPDSKNAMNNQMVEDLTTVFNTLQQSRDIRCIVLSGAEGTFCAGGDIKELRAKSVPDSQNQVNVDVMLRAVNESPQVVIAKVEGAALGGGLGLVCVSDIAIASETAKFGLPEVRLGVSPAYISPYVIQRIGLTRARELMVTGRRFDGVKALEYGFVHIACPPEELDHCIEIELDEVRQCAPGAIAATKKLIFTVYNTPPAETIEYRANLLNQLRSSEEAQEGMHAFIEKRPAAWVTGEEEL